MKVKVVLPPPMPLPAHPLLAPPLPAPPLPAPPLTAHLPPSLHAPLLAPSLPSPLPSPNLVDRIALFIGNHPNVIAVCATHAPRVAGLGYFICRLVSYSDILGGLQISCEKVVFFH